MLRVTPSELRVIPDATPIEHPDEYDGGGRTPKDPRYPAEGVTAASPDDLAEALEAATREEDTDAAFEDLGDAWGSLPDMEWTEESWTEGTKGTQSAQFTRIRVRTVKSTFRRAVTDETGWLLLQKRDGELKAWLCWDVDDWSLAELVLYAHQRWMIEHFHRETKQFLGLNEFPGRTWDGWHRHVTMVVLAYAFLSLERARRDGPAVERLPPVADMARATMREVLVQEHMKESEMDREQAEEVSAVSLRVLFGNSDD